MHKKTITVAVVLFVFIVIGMFIFAYLKKAEVTQVVQDPDNQVQQETSPYDYIEHIDAKHFHIDGTHTVVGTIPFPTPCDLLDWTSDVAESFPEQVTIRFSVINNADMCAQVITDQRFKVTFDASENATIQATLEGRSVELNLVPALPGETPDDFELFIKG